MPTFVELLLSGTLCCTSYVKYFFPDLRYNHNPKSADKTTERLIYSGHRNKNPGFLSLPTIPGPTMEQ